MISPGNRWRLYKDEGWCTAESYDTRPPPRQQLTVTVPPRDERRVPRLRRLSQPRARRLVRHGEPDLGDERRGGRGVPRVLVPKSGARVALLAPGQAHIHRHQDREH